MTNSGVHTNFRIELSKKYPFWAPGAMKHEDVNAALIRANKRWQRSFSDLALFAVAAIFVFRASWTQQFTAFPTHLQTTLAAFAVAICFHRSSPLRIILAGIAGAMLTVFLSATGYFLTGWFYVYVLNQHVVNGSLMLENNFFEEAMGWSIIACMYVPGGALAGILAVLVVNGIARTIALRRSYLHSAPQDGAGKR